MRVECTGCEAGLCDVHPCPACESGTCEDHCADCGGALWKRAPLGYRCTCKPKGKR